MSFLPFGRPQPSSAEKIAAAETEMEMISEMMTRSFHLLSALLIHHRLLIDDQQTESILHEKMHCP